MPVRVASGGEIYRRLRFGRLAELTLLDLRSHRSERVWDGAIADPARSITGDAQMAWLKDGLVASKEQVTWRLVGNPVMISPLAPGSLPAPQLGPLGRLLGVPGASQGVNTDTWDGYTADRQELLGLLHERRIDNTVFLTGDIHTSWANDLPLAASTYPASPSVATELAVPSVTSDNIDDDLEVPPRTVSVAAEEIILAANRHVRWCELDSHGYAVLDVRPERVLMGWYGLSERTRRDASVARMARFAVAAGTQRLQRV
jgi:alkaline phosphatase D